MEILHDTSPEAEKVLVEIYRNMSVGQKWLRIGEIYGRARLLHEMGFRSRKPSATLEEVRDDWIALTLGPPVLQMLKEHAHAQCG
jgi:hypothetical protein